MALLSETARAAAALGSFFVGMPVVARRSAPLDRGPARSLVLAHAERCRAIAGMEIAVEGFERAPTSGPLVVVYNETSLAQDLASLVLLDALGVDRAVFAAEYGLIPWFARAARSWGVELLRRGDRAAVDRTLSTLVDALRAGERISMAPQGRIAPDGRICHFKRGAFLVAIRAQAPVLPVAVSGGAEILAPGWPRMRPGVMRYRVGWPVSTAALGESDAPALAASMQSTVARLLAGGGADRPAAVAAS